VDRSLFYAIWQASGFVYAFGFVVLVLGLLTLWKGAKLTSKGHTYRSQVCLITGSILAAFAAIVLIGAMFTVITAWWFYAR
jgi:hypothetical protein